MRNAEIREIFFSYFQKKGHHKVLSSPLVPAKDPTLLFTNAGMNQFKGVFLQEEKRDYQRAVSIQKCMRVSGKHNDFDEVGKSEYHHTFFEMLGNFSFGDYFKEKAVEYAWEILTEYYKFDPQKLWVTIYKDDDEAHKIWEKGIGVPAHKIIRCGEKDNFWQMGDTGPCGPCSEIHLDRGAAFGPDAFTDGNARYIEVWNLVFMQYSRDETGTLHPLPAPSIDTGMGMERLTSLLQGKDSNYRTDLFLPIIEFTAELAGVSPAQDENQVALKVVADHIRALTFLIADGVLPANDGRGYVLRRILRRAAKHGKSLGFAAPFLHRVSAKAIEVMREFYPELEYNRDFIAEVLLAEEERFNFTLANGLKRFEEILQKTLEDKQTVIPGKELFKLSDTYGFPIDFALDLATEKEIGIDFPGFQQELSRQREQSRSHLEHKQKGTRTLPGLERFQTVFTGYDHLEEEATVLAIYLDNRQAASLLPGKPGIMVCDRSPFYAASGGQTGDTGTGRNDHAFIRISDTEKGPAAEKGTILHHVEVKSGEIKAGDQVRLTIDKERRQATTIHHSSTHLLQAALREVLGLHVKQSGSSVGPERLRFDFTHFKALKPEEIAKVEDIVNRQIRENLGVQHETLRYEQAIERGAIAIFQEKYADIVRVISMGDVSRELCGGTHLHSTGEIGIFKIVAESSIASGVRRIEALAGQAAYNYIQKHLHTLQEIQKYFRQNPEDLVEFLVNLDKTVKDQEKELRKKQAGPSTINLDEIMARALTLKDVPLVATHLDQADRKQLSSLADEIKKRIKGVVVLSTHIDGKSAFIVSIDAQFTNKLNAGVIAKEMARLVNGNGGGRDDFAQGGGDPIDDPEEFTRQVAGILEKHIA